MKRNIYLLIFALVQVSLLSAQSDPEPDYTVLTANITGAYQNSGGDMSDRFGSSNSIGLARDYITKNHYLFGISGDYTFGSNVKEDVLHHLRTNNDLILADGNSLVDVQLRQRGLSGQLYFGKLFSVFQDKRLSGIRAHVGIGMLRHYIKIQDDPDASFAHLSDDLKKGYDRLTYGISTSQFIGFQHLSRNRRINFYFGLEMIQGFTKNRRAYNYDLGQTDLDSKLDLLYNFKIGWILPFYFGLRPEEYRY